MFGWELMNILKNDPAIPLNLIDVNAIDEDWTPPTRLPACCVINTDKSDGSGQHWVSFFIDTDCSADYWDSYGTPPLQPIYSWLLRQGCHPIRYNRKMIQGFTSRTCWAYCAYHIFCTYRPWVFQWIWFQTHFVDINSISMIHWSVLCWKSWDDIPSNPKWVTMDN